jgi:hypothetical protein
MELVKERFNPQVADTVDLSGGAMSAPWLEALLQDRRGRQLIYELAEQHRNCLLLSCAVQSICRGAGSVGAQTSHARPLRSETLGGDRNWSLDDGRTPKVPRRA